MNTLFVQFYTRRNEHPKCYDLGNGFSDTYDFCKNTGEFYWAEHFYDGNKNSVLPINSGIVYVSCLYFSHLYHVYLWALKYPNIKFVVGGGVVPAYIKINLPENLTIITTSVEEYFNIPNFSCKWKLIIPPEIPDDDMIYFTYAIDNICYWKKCNFCSYTKRELHEQDRIRPKSNFEFKDVEYKGKKTVRIFTYASKTINQLINNLPEIDSFEKYTLFIRASKVELKSFKNINIDINKRKKINFHIGIEFATQRMWNYMNKGYILKDVIELLTTIKNRMNLSMIVGWNNLKEQDLIDLEKFMKLLPEGERNILHIYKLYATPGTIIHNTYEIQEKIYCGPFYRGFIPKLNKEQYELNLRAKQIIIEYGKLKKFFIFDESGL